LNIVSAEHAALKAVTTECEDLFTNHFLHLTPDRGHRPEVLFNLNLTRPPALFLAYHVHTYVSLFGPAQWVQSTARYEGLQPDTRYDRFMNTLTVGFADGDNGQWTLAVSIEVESAVQKARVVVSKGTWVETETGWDLSSAAGISSLEFRDNTRSLEDLVVADIKG
jgi:biliverdin reductase